MKTSRNSEVTLEESVGVQQDIYVPLILWNLEILGYISDPPEISTFRAYRCLLKTTGGQNFSLDLKPEVIKSFDQVQNSLVQQTHGEALFSPPFDKSLWTDFITKLVFRLQSD